MRRSGWLLADGEGRIKLTAASIGPIISRDRGSSRPRPTPRRKRRADSMPFFRQQLFEKEIGRDPAR